MVVGPIVVGIPVVALFSSIGSCVTTGVGMSVTVAVPMVLGTPVGGALDAKLEGDCVGVGAPLVVAIVGANVVAVAVGADVATGGIIVVEEVGSAVAGCGVATGGIATIVGCCPADGAGVGTVVAVVG